MLLDSGSSVTILSFDIWRGLPSGEKATPAQSPQHVFDLNGHPLDIVGVQEIKISIPGLTCVHPVFIVRGIWHDCILGVDFLVKHACVIDFSARTLQSRKRQAPTQPVDICLATTTVLEPHTQRFLHATARIWDHAVPGDAALIEPRSDLCAKKGVLTTWALTRVGPTIPVLVSNPSPQSITLYRGTTLARLHDLPSSDYSLQPVPDAIGNTLMSGAAVSKQRRPWNRHELSASIQATPGAHLAPLANLLQAFEDIVSQGDWDLGRTSLTRHTIDTADATPVKQRPRRMAPTDRATVDEKINAMLDMGVIQPSESPWASPIVLVRKKDGGLRFCVDYRRLNDLTTKDAFPLPRIDDTIELLKGARHFSTLDLASGYWQVEMDEASRAQTAFTTHAGLFEFNVLPFGLCNAPSTFQRLMQHVVGDLRYCLCYLDDIIVFSSTPQEHLAHLEQVFTRLRSANLKIKIQKCRFFSSKVLYLGHEVAADGIHTDPTKTDKVLNWPPLLP